MVRVKSWTEVQLKSAVKNSRSVRQVIQKLGLVEAGGNYVQVQHHIKQLKLKTIHFTGKGWSKGLPRVRKSRDLSLLLTKESRVQSFKLKNRLFKEKIKKAKCELCGWSKSSLDGRIPVELDRINGDRFDNRIENLRILCPNCHSLQLTHRGKNKKNKPLGQWRNR